VATGSVPGFLLNQFSMDEHEGHLRVASTTAPERMVVVGRVGEPRHRAAAGGCQPRAGREVDGLGPGERIFAVRFMGDLGYVVTFRQTDPLYTSTSQTPPPPPQSES
jgi:uncharacterized secreted protein with C-terminal beta-propeller domain